MRESAGYHLRRWIFRGLKGRLSASWFARVQPCWLPSVHTDQAHPRSYEAPTWGLTYFWRTKIALLAIEARIANGFASQHFRRHDTKSHDASPIARNARLSVGDVAHIGRMPAQHSDGRLSCARGRARRNRAPPPLVGRTTRNATYIRHGPSPWRREISPKRVRPARRRRRQDATGHIERVPRRYNLVAKSKSTS